MSSFDGKALGEAIVANVREFVGKALASVSARCDELEARIKAIPAGPKGELGEKGTAGLNGKDGAAGIDGKDGAPGAPGKDGAPGEPGPAGKDGSPGIGEKGIDGREGKDGRDGRDGKDGTPGRDALELAILPGLDESKQYPPGTYAHHKGGIVKTTLAGFDVMVNGVASAVVVVLSEREFEVSLGMTDGRTNVVRLSMPVMIYRGIWAPGEFSHGDTVTRGGSVWHCEVEKTEGLPGASPDWKLAVKAGTPGKDGIGKEGPQGRAGKDGKDRY